MALQYKKKFIYSFVASVFIVVFIGFNLKSKKTDINEPEKIDTYVPMQSPDLLRACMIDQAPWGSRENPDHSIYSEIYGEIQKISGLSFVVSIAPLARTLENVRNGFCQFTITSWHPSRSQRVARGAELAVLEYGVFPRLGLSLASIKDLKNRSIATARGLLIGDSFDLDPDIKRVGVYSYQQGVLMVEAGHADGVAGSIITMTSIIKRKKFVKKFGSPLIVSSVPLALQMNHDFAKTSNAKKIDQAVAKLRKNGKAQEIIARFLSDQLVE